MTPNQIAFEELSPKYHEYFAVINKESGAKPRVLRYDNGFVFISGVKCRMDEFKSKISIMKAQAEGILNAIAKAINQKFLLVGYIDQSLVTDASLGGHGVSTETSCFVVGKSFGIYDTYDLAYKVMQEVTDKPEYGFDIKPVFIKGK